MSKVNCRVYFGRNHSSARIGVGSRHISKTAKHEYVGEKRETHEPDKQDRKPKESKHKCRFIRCQINLKSWSDHSWTDRDVVISLFRNHIGAAVGRISKYIGMPNGALPTERSWEHIVAMMDALWDSMDNNQIHCWFIWSTIVRTTWNEIEIFAWKFVYPIMCLYYAPRQQARFTEFGTSKLARFANNQARSTSNVAHLIFTARVFQDWRIWEIWYLRVDPKQNSTRVLSQEPLTWGSLL